MRQSAVVLSVNASLSAIRSTYVTDAQRDRFLRPVARGTDRLLRLTEPPGRLGLHQPTTVRARRQAIRRQRRNVFSPTGREGRPRSCSCRRTRKGITALGALIEKSRGSPGARRGTLGIRLRHRVVRVRVLRVPVGTAWREGGSRARCRAGRRAPRIAAQASARVGATRAPGLARERKSFCVPIGEHRWSSDASDMAVPRRARLLIGVPRREGRPAPFSCSRRWPAFAGQWP